MEDDRIITGKGLWNQIQNCNKVEYAPLTLDGLISAFTDLQYGSIRKYIRDALENNNSFSGSEKELLLEMSNSSDIESIKLAKEIIDTRK